MENYTCPFKDQKYIMRVIDFIKRIEDENEREPQDVYSQGNCGNLYSHLKLVFRCASAYYREKDDHVRTVIEVKEGKGKHMKTKKLVIDISKITDVFHSKDILLDDETVKKLYSNNYQVNQFRHKISKEKEAQLIENEKRYNEEIVEKKLLAYIQSEEFLR
jgi:hypothetical protein